MATTTNGITVGITTQGSILRRERDKRGYSQPMIAKVAGINKDRYSRIELDKSPLTRDVAERIASFYGIPFVVIWHPEMNDDYIEHVPMLTLPEILQDERLVERFLGQSDANAPVLSREHFNWVLQSLLVIEGVLRGHSLVPVANPLSSGE
jgi:transcriptional regulator with XRE-family HTH domain